MPITQKQSATISQIRNKNLKNKGKIICIHFSETSSQTPPQQVKSNIEKQEEKIYRATIEISFLDHHASKAIASI